ncbi:GSH [Mytilus coruscus]|uniref:GSH n=1 Tax=Mytilus coruscus TaxID=42192 RepID=A0A6J8AIM5_MYTCO|nr:GSH [Mytilus coruscus]
MAYQQNASTKMSYSIEELLKSSRISEPICIDAVVYYIHDIYLPNSHDIYLPNSSQSCATDIMLSLTNSAQRTKYKRKRLNNSLHSDDNSFSSADSTSRECTSPGSCSDDSVTSDQPMQSHKTSSQLLELERYYSCSQYLKLKDRQLLAKNSNSANIRLNNGSRISE